MDEEVYQVTSVLNNQWFSEVVAEGTNVVDKVDRSDDTNEQEFYEKNYV